MGPDPSVYAVLGLRPDASAADVERAYKRLIKAHHPDREGGDAVRASEINRAYQQLRRALRIDDGLAFHDLPPRRASGWGPTAWAASARAARALGRPGPGVWRRSSAR